MITWWDKQMQSSIQQMNNNYLLWGLDLPSHPVALPHPRQKQNVSCHFACMCKLHRAKVNQAKCTNFVLCSLFLQLSLKVGVKVWLKCELFQAFFFPAQGVLFCPNFVPKGKLTMKKTFYWKVFKILSKKQQTSMPDLFDWHVLILPENYKIITATKWLKQKNCMKDAGIPPLCMYSFIIHSSIQCPSQQKNNKHCTARPVSSNAKDIVIDTLCQFVSILAHSVFLCCSTMVTNSNLQDFVYFYTCYCSVLHLPKLEYARPSPPDSFCPWKNCRRLPHKHINNYKRGIL